MTDTWKTTQILPTCHQAGFAVGTQALHPSFTTEVCPVLLAQEKTAGDGTTTTRVVPAHWGRGQEIVVPAETDRGLHSFTTPSRSEGLEDDHEGHHTPGAPPQSGRTKSHFVH